MIEIRRATHADRDAIWQFLREVFPGRHRYKAPDLWRWQFEESPYVDPGALPIWLAVDRERVVGQSAMLAVPVRIRGRDRAAVWAVDAIVLPECRRQGIGGRLVRITGESNPVLLSLGVSDAIRGIKKKKQGSVDLPPVEVFRRTLRPSPAAVRDGFASRLAPRAGTWRRLLTGTVRVTGLDHVLAWSLGRREAHRVRSLGDQGLTVEIAEGFGEEHDALFDRVAPAFDALVRRDATYLDWKYRRAPYVQYVTMNLRREGELRGWVVVREGRPPEAPAGVIADLLAAPGDGVAVRALAGAALRWCVDRRLAFAVAATSVPAYAETFRSLGFESTRTEIGMGRVDPAEPELARAVVQGPWLLAKADSDWDHFPSGF